MTRSLLLETVALAILTIGLLTNTSAQANAQGTFVDPEAARILERMTDYLGGLERFSVETINMIDEVLLSGQKIQLDFDASLVLQRPNRLRAHREAHDADQLFLYDGRTFTILDRHNNHYATVEAPGNIDDLLHFARDALDIVPPVGDMVFSNAYELLTRSVTDGWVVGKATIDGVECDHLAFSTPVVDWQIWIAEGDRPLPYKYALTTRDDPAQPQYIVLMHNWDLDPEVNEGLFAFTPSKGAHATKFVRREAIPPGDR